MNLALVSKRQLGGIAGNQARYANDQIWADGGKGREM
jgi:hypothetical protein